MEVHLVMSKRGSWYLLGIILAVALGYFVPQLMVSDVKGTTSEVTYQFTNMGMTTSDSRKEMQEILEGIIGISQVDIHPGSDQIQITFDEETMKAEWIAKSLEAHGYHPESYKKLK